MQLPKGFARLPVGWCVHRCALTHIITLRYASGAPLSATARLEVVNLPLRFVHVRVLPRERSLSITVCLGNTKSYISAYSNHIAANCVIIKSAGDLPGMRLAATRIARSLAALSQQLLRIKPEVLPWQRAAEAIAASSASGPGVKDGNGTAPGEAGFMLDGEGPMVMPPKQHKVWSRCG